MRDETVIEEIRRGDGSAIDGVMKKYAKLLWRIAGQILHSDSDLEECVADVFIDLWQHPDRFDPTRGTLKTFLCIAVRSKALDRCRHTKRYTEFSLEDTDLVSDADLTDELFNSESKKVLSVALQTLAESDRELLFLRYYDGLKPKAIAAVLGIPVKQVENRLYRIRRKLRDLIPVLKGDCYEIDTIEF